MVNGAVSTIATLLKKPETRSAAVTMLGKSVELCTQQMLACDPKILGDLRAALEGVTEEAFR